MEFSKLATGQRERLASQSSRPVGRYRFSLSVDTVEVEPLHPAWESYYD